MNNTKNAKITSVVITNADHGLLTCFVNLEHESGAQGFGGYQLYTPKFPKRDHTGFFLWRIMETVGVSRIEDLKGKIVRIEGGHSKIDAIGHVIEDKWFNPSKEMKNNDS